MSRVKHLFAVALAALMLCLLMPITAFAEEASDGKMLIYINRTTINKEAAIKPESIKQDIKIRKYSNLFDPYDSRSAVIRFLFDKCFCVCQEGWHRPALSLFAKVFVTFSCELPKVACSRNILLTQFDFCSSVLQQFNMT